MIERAIPPTGEMVPAAGIGTRNFRTGPSVNERAPFKATLQAFVELGGRVLDTAPSYGNSETVVGDLSAEFGITDDLFLVTKVDREGSNRVSIEWSPR